MEENPLYKKAYFQCARRAILENELVMRRFAEEVVNGNYSDEKLGRFNILLTEMYDNDMFDLLMGNKIPEDFKDRYDFEICKEMAAYAATHKVEGKTI